MQVCQYNYCLTDTHNYLPQIPRCGVEHRFSQHLPAPVFSGIQYDDIIMQIKSRAIPAGETTVTLIIERQTFTRVSQLKDIVMT